MVDLNKARTERRFERRPVNCRIPVVYLDKLKKDGVGFTDFVMQAFAETYPKIK